MNIYVGNIPRASTSESLKETFEQYGTVNSIRIITDRFTGESRGFAFVEMNDDEAKAAIEALDGTQFEGRTLRVNEARPPAPRQDRGPRGGSGGGSYGGPRGPRRDNNNNRGSGGFGRY